MGITISGNHMDLGESFQGHIESHLHNLLQKYMDGEPHAQVHVHKTHASKEKFTFKTDVHIHVAKGFDVRADSEDVDAYKSFNDAVQKLETRIKRYKNRLRDRKRQEMQSDPLSVPYFVIDSSQHQEEDAPTIIAETVQNVPHVSVSEAVMHMELGGQPVFVFKNASTDSLNVVYRRKDGHVGWIDPSKKAGF